MTLFSISAVDVFNPVTAEGAPRGGAMGEARTWGTEVERAVSSVAASGGALVYNLKTVLDTDLAHPSNSMAWLIGDPVAANNGIYLKSGDSGAGYWTRIGDLPYQVITLTVTGTANALIGTSALPIPAADRAALLIFDTPLANTGPVTMANNGAAALPVVDRYGNALTANFFAAGGAVIAVKQGGAIRTFLDTDAAVARAAAEAARDAAIAAETGAQTAETAAEAARDIAVSARDTVATLFLGTGSTFPTTGPGGAPLVVNARFVLTGQPDPNNNGEYIYYGPGDWRPNFGPQPARLDIKDGYVALADGETVVTVPGGYIPGNAFTVLRNGTELWLGPSPAPGPSSPDATAADGATIVFPASLALAKGERISWIISRPSTLAAVTATDATVAPIPGYVATNAQQALEELAANLAALEVGVASEQYHVSVSAPVGGALTVALKTVDDLDPSVGSPLSFGFRGNSGGVSQISLTAALAAGASAGSTFGLSNNVPFSLYFVLLDDGGVPRLGLVNPRLSDGLLELRSHREFSSTAEGGAGGADSAGVIYTGAAVSSKLLLVLARLDWDAGLAAAGTWVAPTRTKVLGPGDPMPGDVIGRRHAGLIGGSSTASTSYVDVTGASVSITPKRPQNAVKISATGSAQITLVASQNTTHTATLLQGATDLGTSRITGAGSGTGGLQAQGAIAMDAVVFPGSVALQTFKVQHKTNNASATASTNNLTMIAEEIAG